MFLRWFLVSCPGFVHPAWPECQPRPWPLLFYQSLTSIPLSSSASSFLSLLSLLPPPLNELSQHGFPLSLLSPPSFHLWFPLCACIFSALTSTMSVRLHPSPHLLITQQIHANMYLWLSWGTYVIICKKQTDFWSATSRGHFMMIAIVLQLHLFTFISPSARAVCVYSLFPVLRLTTEPANRWQHHNPGCKICLCSQN